ncbi:MAG: S26 family signal peptidase [Solirubrobacteraceae bacterium]
MTAGAARTCRSRSPVPPDGCFMMGANRGASPDSRCYRPVRSERIQGRGSDVSQPVGEIRGL